jgi:pimeloyl-ACP methyl ester carboxylesterase
MRLLLLLPLLAALCTAETKIETGDINGARFRIEMPEKWNGGLVMYCHGYSPVPGTFDNPKPNPVLNVFVEQGYAVAQSGYAAGGWAIQEAIQDTEALRRYFVRKYGAPKETYVTGHSMGGFLTMMIMERFPNSYDAGLPLCGPLAPADLFFTRNVFDMRVVFDYLFPGALPAPDNVPADFTMSTALNSKIQDLLDSKAEQGKIMLRYTGIHTTKELAGTIVFFTYILKDLQQRGGGNPFDNRDTIYAGTPDDNALNDGVKRYAANQRAAEYIRAWYTPTGRILHPMLAIHTTYDPLVPPWIPNDYARLAAQAGNSALFAQQYVKHAGHCAIFPAEVARGFVQLREWKNGGARPR